MASMSYEEILSSVRSVSAVNEERATQIRKLQKHDAIVKKIQLIGRQLCFSEILNFEESSTAYKKCSETFMSHCIFYKLPCLQIAAADGKSFIRQNRYRLSICGCGVPHLVSSILPRQTCAVCPAYPCMQ